MLLYKVLIFFLLLDESNGVFGVVTQIGSSSCMGVLFSNSLLMTTIQEFAQNCFGKTKLSASFVIKQASLLYRQIKHQGYF